MKLYTEEQVMEAIKSGFTLAMLTDGGLKEHQKEFIKTLIPIELPSDEEIEDKAFESQWSDTLFKDGAKWMRDKIQGGEK